MQSKTSYFNGTLFRKNLTRFWPIWAIYTAIWAVMLPLSIFIQHMEFTRYQYSTDYAKQLADFDILSLTSGIGVAMAFCFGLLAAMSVFSYLYNSRSAGLMHTLPIRREGLFLTNWLSGYCFMLLPHLLIAGLTVLAELAAGCLNLGNIAMWLLIQGGVCFFFYSFAVLCAMFTGHILALPAFYGILNFLAAFLSALFDNLLSIFTFGYVSSGTLSGAARWFTPTFLLVEKLRFRTVVENGVETELFTGFQYVLLYAAVGLVFTVCAVLLYRARHIETAGDVISVRRAKPIFKYGFAFCAALGGGMFLYLIFSSLLTSVVVSLTIFMVLAGSLGCFVAEMLLQKSFKVFRRGWKACGVFSLVVIVMMFGLSRDLFGAELRVPEVSSVETLRINMGGFPPYDTNYSNSITDPETIANFIAIHQSIVDHRVELQSNSYQDTADDWKYLSLRYTLSNGRSLFRTYSIPFQSNQAEVSGSLEELTLSAINSTDYLLSCYFPYDDVGGTAVEGYLSVYNTEKSSYEGVSLTTDQATRIAAAARADVTAGRLGIHYLDDLDPERRTNCSYTDLELNWLYTNARGDRDTSSSIITPQFTATETMNTLTELGILDETHILRSHDVQDTSDALAQPVS